MELILNFLLAVCVLIVIFIGAFAGKMQATTLWAGKRIAPFGMDAELPTGFQDAITPKIQDKFNTVLPISYIGTLVLGTFVTWYMGVLLLVIAFVLMSVVQRFLPNTIEFYLKWIMHYMANKTADYAKENDKMRAEASDELFEKLGLVYEEIKGSGMKVPKFDEIKAMPLGNIF